MDLLRKTYINRLQVLQKIKNQGNIELTNLYAQRQILIEKNMAGTYSDDIFKEQNKIIEEKIAIIYTTQNDDHIEKYNIEQIDLFINEKFKDLSITFQKSSLL